VGKVKVRYFVERLLAGRTIFYWQPAQALRASGFRLQRLPDDRRKAIDQANALNEALDAWRNGAAIPGAPAPAELVQPKTLAWVIRGYKASRFYTGLRDRTKRSYDQNIDFLEAWGGDKRVAAITPQTVETLYTSLYVRTPSKAAAVITMLRILLEAARRQNLVTENAASKAGIKGSKPSGRIWPREAVRLFAEAADTVGWHSVGTAVVLNHWLGQREADILELPRSAIGNGRITILQSKTGARVSIPDNPIVRARIEAELGRQEARAAAARSAGATPLPPATFLVCESTGLPWTEHYFRHVFADIRTALAKEHPTIAHADGTPTETATLLMMHLRHTAVTEMAVAGCTALQISGVTGHTIASVNLILSRYMSLTEELADSAVARRLAYEGRHCRAVDAERD
jgi:hypothetical protein